MHVQSKHMVTQDLAWANALCVPGPSVALDGSSGRLSTTANTAQHKLEHKAIWPPPGV